MNLDFLGKVRNGAGLFSKENLIPSPIKELSTIKGWPNEVVNGTFNIQIESFGWPSATNLDFKALGVRCLDRSIVFRPAAYLDHSYVPNNTIRPDSHGEHGGDLQFWRAKLTIQGVEESIPCYMLRRVSSGYIDTIEVVSHIHIRTTYKIRNGQHVKLTVFAGGS